DAKDEDKARWNSITWNEDADGYRLPTEAEWEFAAKGGIKEEEDPIYSGSDVITDVAWNADTPDGETHDVAGKLPNALGLYDMSGNVWEWVWDWYGNYHTVDNSNPKGAEADVTGRKMRRGGSIKSDAVFCRNANRASSVPELRGVDLGFRIVRNADDDFLAGNADETESEDADDELPAVESEDEDSESDAEVAEVSSVVIVPETEDEDTPLISIDLDDEGNLVMDVDEDQALDSFGIER
ncbi:MAG: SUMF1/EgtB/PvdO family nonheme iron enzyme, partial [Treponema sp.]|nr:SUMF1/EgtB/PvdO family nonheme iron enzyme [Treponema sp.]